MKFTAAFNALNVITKTPIIRAWLGAIDPKALQQAEDAIMPPAVSTEPVEVVTAALLVERLENIIPNLGIGTAVITGERCNGRVYVTVLFPVKTTKEAAMAFCQFCKMWMHGLAAFQETKSGGTGRYEGYSVLFIIDEDNA